MENQYQLLTNYRMSLFGIALIWIFFRHTFYYYNYSYFFLDPLVQIGDCGVDIFMFLSGFGLFFSYMKTPNLFLFYKKRFTRIVPTVLIMLFLFRLILIVLHNDNLLSVFSLYGWFNAIYSKYWFIGAILLFYTLFPIVFVSIKKKVWLTLLSSFLLAIGGVTIIRILNVGALNQLVVYFARIPAFVLGSVFAYRQDLFEKKKKLFICALLSLPMLYFLPKDYQRIAYSLTTIGMLSFLPQVLNHSSKWINKLLSLIGESSLEFYLIHIFLFSYGVLSVFDMYVPYWCSALIILFLVTLLSILSKQVVSKITALYK